MTSFGSFFDVMDRQQTAGLYESESAEISNTRDEEPTSLSDLLSRLREEELKLDQTLKLIVHFQLNQEEALDSLSHLERLEQTTARHMSKLKHTLQEANGDCEAIATESREELR